ncbi:unnamed protein product [Clonostachys rosea]|uniref:F-box domain-containing protein n=1 Tax=Bionectria ochroleuca TaxID=29856 RepID=A0ABY6TQ99_BIOOC|nr:unnamed protein product [Clonostachys rosea]
MADFRALASYPFRLIASGASCVKNIFQGIWDVLPWSQWKQMQREDSRRQQEHNKFFVDRILRPAAATPISTAIERPASENTSPLFNRIPPEVRRDILLYAFGEHTLHMDLGFQAPPKRVDEEPTDPGRTAHAGIESQEFITFGDRMGHWRWGGCVCHRSPPEEDPLSLGRLRSDPIVRARGSYYTDGCLVGEAACPHWPGQWPVKCQIGIMGWLLSCRQAYLEGMEVLYGTNTIQVSCKLLLRGFPELLSSTVLSHIRSLKLVINPQNLQLRHVFIGHYEQFHHRQTPKSPLFPSLSYLHIWLSGPEYELLGLADADALQAASADGEAVYAPPDLDSTIIRLAPATATVTVTCPFQLWFRSVETDHFNSQGEEWTQERESEYGGLEFWRQMPIGGLPKTTEQWEAAKKNGRGYWIHLGPGQDVRQTHQVDE